jgi:DNA-binding response OmpR family regulator
MTAASEPRLRVLIADDERDTATTLAAVLRDEGHDVHVALRGDDLVDMDRLLHADVIVCDLKMPGMTGYACAREIRERRGPLAPLLIAISGKWKQKPDELLAHEVGFDHYLLKPCEPAQLIELVRAFAARARGRAEPGKG